MKIIFVSLMTLLLLLTITTSLAEEVSSADLFSNCKKANLGYKWNKRKANGFASSIAAKPDTLIYSNCMMLNEIGKVMRLTSHSDLKISVNGNSFTDFPVNITNKDKIVISTKTLNHYNFTHTLSVNLFGNNEGDLSVRSGLLSWNIQTTNTSRSPKVWLVGPKQKYTQISDIIPKLSAGDEILLEGDTTYAPVVIKEVSGTKELPIKLTGITVNNKRPVIQGDTKNRYNWGVALRHSHYWEISNLIIEKADICYRHESAFITIKDTLIQHCGNGILGTDGGSGSLTVSHSEIRYSGRKLPNAAWEHGVYVGTDRDKFPKSKLTITHSFLHNNQGNTIKSRAEEAYIYGNWIENSKHKKSIYAIELVGFDGYETIDPIHHDVSGNVISINSQHYGVRAGGDGTGISNGITNFSENVFLINNGNFKDSVFRLFGKLQQLLIQNNLFIDNLPKSQKISLIRDYMEVKDWPSSMPNILIKNNRFTSKISPYVTSNGNNINSFEGKYKKIRLMKNEYISNQKAIKYNINNNFNGIATAFETLSPRTIYPPLINVKVFDKHFNPFLYQKPTQGDIPYR